MKMREKQGTEIKTAAAASRIRISRGKNMEGKTLTALTMRIIVLCFTCGMIVTTVTTFAYLLDYNSHQNIHLGNDAETDNTKITAQQLQPESWWKGRLNVTNASHPHFGARHPNGTLQMTVNPSTDRLMNPINASEIKIKLNIQKSRKFQMKSKELRTNNLENMLSGTESGSQSQKDSISYDLICPAEGGAGIEGEIGNKVLKRIKTGVQKYKADIINSNSYIGANYYSNSKSDSDNVNDNHTHTSTGNVNDNGTPRRRSRILCMIYTVNLPNDNHTNLQSIAQTWGRQCDGFFAASNSTDHSLGAINLVHLGQESC